MRKRFLIPTVVFFQALLVVSADAQYQDPNAELRPKTDFDGAALKFDFPGMLIGVAEYSEGPTGTTLFYFPERVKAAVDVRGGAPGTINTDLLRLGYEEPFTNGIALSGGSAYGLGAATGAAQEMKTRLKDPGWWTSIPVVSGAIIFDLGARRYNAVTPDERLGRAAVRAARPGYFPLGARGAGRFAMQGAYYNARQHSGQGAAYKAFGDVRVAAFTVVNAFGGIVDRDGRFVRCGVPVRSDCPKASSVLRQLSDSSHNAGELTRGLTSNTTISLVVTNQRLTFAELQRFAMQTHTSMARAIQPFHTINDGDTLFAISTDEVEGSMSTEQLGVQAGELMWDAVLASVPAIQARPSVIARPVPVTEVSKYVGSYEFAPGMRAKVDTDGESLVIHAPVRASMYLPSASVTKILPASSGDFVLDNQRADVIRFEINDSDQVTGLVINPGLWPVKAARAE